MTKLHKPRDVVGHCHFWPSEADLENDTNRLDVCELENGTSVIWNVDDDEIVFRGTWDECLEEARSLAGSQCVLLS